MAELQQNRAAHARRLASSVCRADWRCQRLSRCHPAAFLTPRALPLLDAAFCAFSGKTSIFNRYVYDEFGNTSMTIGAYFGMKQCKVGDKNCNLAIWDTAGEEKFDSLTNFCQNTHQLTKSGVARVAACTAGVGSECNAHDVCACMFSAPDCRNATAALVCYDITNYETFANLQRWVEKIHLEAEKNCRCVDTLHRTPHTLILSTFPETFC